MHLTLPNGGSRVVTAEAADTFPDSAKEFISDRNLIGIVHGSDPTVADEVIVVGAHFDHVGVGRPVDGGFHLPTAPMTTRPVWWPCWRPRETSLPEGPPGELWSSLCLQVKRSGAWEAGGI